MNMSESNHLLYPERQPATLQLTNVDVAYPPRLALHNLSFSIPHGARVAVVGPNGAGKSTLFKALVGLLPIQRGQVLIHGLPIGQHQDCVAYIPQREEVDWRFPVRVQDVIMMGRFGRLGWWQRPGKADQAIVQRAIQQMGIDNLADRPIGDLSGGQQQRVFLARALAQEPHILLMDEPFNGVDAATQEATLALLDQLHSEQVTVLVSTHDLSLAANRFEQILLLNRHLVAFGPPEQVFQPENLRLAFGPQVLFLNGNAIVDECCPPDEEHQHTHSKVQS
jgi:ABC-type Mn2+/Zn2+ transport system ATPase subunit